MLADVVIIGAGCAGLSAAVRLADAGLKVVVAEEAPRLGGRATSFEDRETRERVDNGQHVLFGCYRETYAFLDRLGTSHLAPLQDTLELTMADLDGRAFPLRCPRWTPPWHLLGGLMRWGAVPLRDRLGALRLARLLRAARRDGPAAAAARAPQHETVAAWLSSQGQSPLLCVWLWHPLAVAALNQAPDAASCQPFVRVLAELFGPDVRDSAIGVPRVPLDQLYAQPAARYIEARGGVVLTRVAASVGLDDDGRVARVVGAEETIQTRQVVSAVPWHAFGRIWERAAPNGIAPIAERAAAMRSSPIVTANLWLDRTVPLPTLVGLVGGTFHWMFDKRAIFGDAAAHLALVASGAAAVAALDNAAATEAAASDLRRAIPAAANVRVTRSVVVREQRATFSLAPDEPARPPAATPLPGFTLAGDWTDTGLPGTIEGAVKSGHAAADHILRGLR